ncbi:CDGSH-type Zn-finger protein/ferredoxin [Methanohalophilus levihalophilus]|uniref:CDGSH iron-sulfur domain-containing protein n=1 Tax=Methanohalophilus levihalophilus TaxID=1431282 RepID=UPI001AE888C8|nr:CDGSH iron-sulfur domain-containing protein [Methanohalophilus levihalophilus]MBP2029094.1 CDGSH-type Zn-finger protein/ferredoxin [Methanohalophilus levihalophilus]
MSSSNEENKPTIKVTKDGPYIVSNLENLRNSKGVFIETKPVIALCRCGGSTTKPFCSGAHTTNGFSGDKQEDRVPDQVDTYVGEKITIHDNRGVCSHMGHCTDNLPNVFRMKTEPWIDPDGASPEEIEHVIKMCPSGALSYTKDGVLHKEYPHEPEIFVGKNRSYNVVGGIELEDPDGSKPETQDHYTLCRCGGSRNKPFCDGTHWYNEFDDETN